MTETQRILLMAVLPVIAATWLQGCEKRCAPGKALIGGTCTPVTMVDGQVFVTTPAAGGSAPASQVAGAAAAAPSMQPSSGGARASGQAPSSAAEQQQPASPSSAAGAANDAGPPGDAQPSVPKPACKPEEVRCNPSTPGTLDSCEAGEWASQPCAAGEMCLDTSEGSRCVSPVEACVGQEGQNVCTDAGEMLACMAGGEAMMIASCADSALCKAGIAAGKCAACVPGHSQCEGAELTTCDPDGAGYVAQDTCASAALCDAEQGRCNAPACEAQEHVCEGDTLKRCNAELTELVQARQCQPGLCDEQNGTCRMCMPGQARCSGSMRQECDAEGQAFAAAACPESAPFCLGNGECTQCRLSSDCKPRACHVSSCLLGECSERAERAGARPCSQADGTTIRPTSGNPDGKIYVIAGGAAFHIVYGEDLDAHFGGVAGVRDVASLCGTRPVAGSNLQEVGDDRIVHIGEDGLYHHIVHGEDLSANCGGLSSVAKIPRGGLAANGIRQGDPIQ